MIETNHLEILNRGLSAWNQWREENPKELPRLRGVTS